MNFGTWIDSGGTFFDTTHFPESLAAFPFVGRGCYKITGSIDLDFGYPTLTVESMERMVYIGDYRYDFGAYLLED